jgi:hypothetical protein
MLEIKKLGDCYAKAIGQSTSIMRPFFRNLEQIARLFLALATGTNK